jgi:hypothetical protein
MTHFHRSGDSLLLPRRLSPDAIAASPPYPSCGENLVCITYVDGLNPDAATGTIAIPVPAAT